MEREKDVKCFFISVSQLTLNNFKSTTLCFLLNKSDFALVLKQFETFPAIHLALAVATFLSSCANDQGTKLSIPISPDS